MRASLNSLSNINRQAGAVLIMALLIVALVAGLSIKFAGDYQLGLARAESRWHGVQARAYLLGMENAALELLVKADQNPQVDYLGEGWDTEVPFEIDGGWVLARAADASSQLNLNALNTLLVAEKPANSFERYSEPQRRFIRLLQTFPDLPVQENDAIAILEAIVDWMDADDNQSGFGGAESDYYQSMPTPYNAANGVFMSVDELRLVRYMTPELMMLLRPYITVLPVPDGQNMNVNTMPAQLLLTLNDKQSMQPLDAQQAEQLAGAIPADGFYQSTADFQSAWNNAVGAGELDVGGLEVKTNFFSLFIQVDLVEQRRGMQTLLKRNGDKFEVVRRNDTY